MQKYQLHGVQILSQEWKNLAEGSPLAIVRGHNRTLRKKAKK